MSEHTLYPDELLPWHKRQATLLYHYASLAYLEGLLPRIDALIARADIVVLSKSPRPYFVVWDGVMWKISTCLSAAWSSSSLAIQWSWEFFIIAIEVSAANKWAQQVEGTPARARVMWAIAKGVC